MASIGPPTGRYYEVLVGVIDGPISQVGDVNAASFTAIYRVQTKLIRISGRSVDGTRQ